MNYEAILAAASLIPGWMTEPELRWLAYQAAHHKRIVEVGSWKGRSTKALAGFTPGRVFAVDTWEGSPGERATHHAEASERGANELLADFCEYLDDEIASGRCVPVRLPSVRAARVFGHWDGLRPDMVFLDGDHAYDAVLADLTAWAACAAPGALLSGHDYNWPDVARAVFEVLGPSVTRGPGALWYTYKES
jgi:hypothetical protein